MGEIPKFEDVRSIGGWMSRSDHLVFQAVARLQASVSGDLLEIGAFEGRSTVVIGGIARAGESVHVCDPFEEGGEIAVAADTYDGLREGTFRSNYRRFHDADPVVHKCLSSQLDFGSDVRFRFIHIDGSHAFENVAADLALSRSVSMPAGVVVLDDYRKIDTPGVSAAVWSAVAVDGLHPLVLTEQKMYATWGPSPYSLRDVEAAIAEVGGSTRRVPVRHGVEALYAFPRLSSPQRIVLAAVPSALLSRSDRLRGFVGQR